MCISISLSSLSSPLSSSSSDVVEIEDLGTKIKKLSFINKKQDFYNKSSIVSINTSITSGKVSVTIKIRKAKRTYEVEGITNAIGIHTNAYDTLHITYILTEDGKVYKLEDDLHNVETTEGYKGEAHDLGLVNVVKIAVSKKLKFKLNNNLEKIVPCVYIITDDDRIFTDESFIEGKTIVELVEKKKENTNENASVNN